LGREEARRIDGNQPTVGSKDGANFIARFGVSPSKAIRDTFGLLTTIRSIVDSPRAELECGGSVVRLYATARSAPEVTALVAACRARCCASAGTLLFERLPADQRHGVDVWYGPIRGLSLMQRLKEKFDPYGVLAPGRFVGGI